ncbi:glycosyltransferase family 2 protein [Sporolactobacillus putidus]|uniref:Glycosyl transferase n=1 Tax=Sporolactobacillus putidus TaxID=492735 RepID=A0A917S1J9_9BACL|nr:glycosyltransferase family 2 protein [Sporolactobacillus putidus]GGL50609.1 glycosyl transferase [Sporolactobacillus putidus]
MKQISIIIPVYNSEHLIAGCLDSIIHQEKRPPIEIILVNDGSTDGTLAVLEKYEKEYDFIKVVTQENQKQSAARNNGLKQASGKYVMFFDSDDYLEDGMLSAMYDTIEADKSDLCICGIKKIFPDRTETETESCLKNSSDPIADFLTHHREMDVGLWNKIFRLDKIRQNGLVFENGNFFEDTLFVFKYICNISEGISFVERPLYNLFKRENSTTTKYNADIEIYSGRLVRKIKEYLREKGLEEDSPYVDVLETRNLIHIVHHNLKFNQTNKDEKIRQLLSGVNLQTFRYMSNKYRIALLLMKISPSLYEKIYLRKKNV